MSGSREMLVHFLESRGHETMSAANGAEALEQLRRQLPCLVLLDMQMPVMTGWDFRRQQVQDSQFADVPVIAITAYFDPGDVEQELGIRCLSKTGDIFAIEQEVRAVCGAARD